MYEYKVGYLLTMDIPLISEAAKPALWRAPLHQLALMLPRWPMLPGAKNNCKRERKSHANAIAPGRNRGIYLLGHLVAVHDLMLPLLRFEDVIYPDLQPVFVDAPDRAFETMPPVEILRKQ